MVQGKADVGHVERRQPPRHVAHESDALVAQVEQPGREQPADDEHQRTGNGGVTARSPNTTSSATTPTTTVAPCASSSDPSHENSSWNGFAPVTSVPGELRQLADHDVDGGAEQEPGDDCAGQELSDPSHSQHGQGQEHQP